MRRKGEPHRLDLAAHQVGGHIMGGLAPLHSLIQLQVAAAECQQKHLLM